MSGAVLIADRAGTLETMSLKFTFGGSNPDTHDHSDTPSGATSLPLTSLQAPGSGPLEFMLALDSAQVSGEARSGSGVAYATASKPVTEQDAAVFAGAIRSVLSRLEAELVEPLRGTATAIEIAIAPATGLNAAGLLSELGVDATTRAVGEALQARTGVSAGTPIRLV